MTTDDRPRILGLVLVVTGLVIVVLFGALYGLASLYEYRADKVTDQSARAERVWHRLRAGMSSDDVRSLAGSPSAKHGSCWTWGEGWVWDAADVYRACFRNGRVVETTVSASSD